MTKSTKIILLILTVFVVIIVGFISLLAYSSIKDVSDKAPYSNLINKTFVFHDTCTLLWYDKPDRFQNYSLANEYSQHNLENVKSVKHYLPGDKIKFHSVMRYYSIHVNETFYLIGKDTLENEQIIAFQYYYSSNEFKRVFKN